MLYGNDPAQYRNFFREAWRKHREGAVMDPMESMVAQIIAVHPEYHTLLDTPDVSQQEFTPETGNTNPFLHMGLHIAIQEQVTADRPAGIRAVYQDLLKRLSDPHDLEHRMAECLAESLWEAQRGAKAPDEAAYLERLRRL